MPPPNNVGSPGLFADSFAARDAVVPKAFAAVAPVLPVHGVVGIDQPAPDPTNPDIPLLTVTMTPSPTTAADAAIATATGSPGDSNPTECRLLGSFAILVQLALGALAMLSLVYKRWRERPQRPVKIWFFDVSKQVFGSVLVHVANVFMSMLTSGRFSIKVMPETVATVTTTGAKLLLGRGDSYVPNPCSFYLLNLAIDTTLGIPILIIIVRLTTKLVAVTPFGKPVESIQSGNYGHPPNAWWWLKQSFIYFCGLMGMKICVLIIFMLFPWLSRVGDWALGWTEGNEKLQIIFVMMLFPLIMNAMQYYIIDSYIKLQDAASDTASSNDEEGRNETVVYGEISGSDSEESDGEDEDGRKHVHSQHVHGRNVRLARRDSSRSPPLRDDEYDPNVDGDSQTVVGSSASRDSRRGPLPKELLPRE